MTQKKTDLLGSFAKGLRVLAVFGQDRPVLTISQAAELADLDRATARRCLLTLANQGYAHSDGKYFRLTDKAVRLSNGVLMALPLGQIVQPWLDRLATQINQSCSVAVLDGHDIVYIARAAQQKVMSITLAPGSRLPAHWTSMGRVLLAALPPAQRAELLNSCDLTPRTPLSKSSIAEIEQSVERANAKGYAAVDQEIEIGLRSLAVPLKNNADTTVAALNTGLAAFHQDIDDMVATYLPHLRAVQKGLRESLPL